MICKPDRVPSIENRNDDFLELGVDEILAYFTEKFYNPSAPYALSRQVRDEVERARAVLAHAIGARPGNVVLTAGATEANNLAFAAISEDAHVIVDAIEHESVLATAIYSADEAFLAAMNGADYLAPYVNRMCNYGDGIGQVFDLMQMLETHGLNSKILAASFKNTEQVHALISAGIDAITLPPDIVYTMMNHPGTKIAVDEFSVAWREAYGRDTLLG